MSSLSDWFAVHIPTLCWMQIISNVFTGFTFKLNSSVGVWWDEFTEPSFPEQIWIGTEWTGALLSFNITALGLCCGATLCTHQQTNNSPVSPALRSVATSLVSIHEAGPAISRSLAVHTMKTLLMISVPGLPVFRYSRIHKHTEWRLLRLTVVCYIVTMGSSRHRWKLDLPVVLYARAKLQSFFTTAKQRHAFRYVL